MIIVVLAVVGLSLGSFINALVWRIHEHKNWVSGRSECVYCHHRLSVGDLIPVFSWLILRGKCRYCHKKISLQYPVVELMTPLVFVALYLFWPTGLSSAMQWSVFIGWLLAVVGLLALAVYDLRWMILPNGIVLYLLVLAVGLTAIAFIGNGFDWYGLLDAAVGALIGGGLFYGLFQVSKGKWIGGGDVKLGFVLGLFAGSAQRSFLLIFLAALIGCVISVPFLLFGKLTKKSIIPFGPFLIVSIVIVQLAGTAILGWYGRTFLGL